MDFELFADGFALGIVQKKSPERDMLLSSGTIRS